MAAEMTDERVAVKAADQTIAVSSQMEQCDRNSDGDGNSVSSGSTVAIEQL